MKIIVGTKTFSQFPGTLHEPNFKKVVHLSEMQNDRAHLQEDFSRYSGRAKNCC